MKKALFLLLSITMIACQKGNFDKNFDEISLPNSLTNEEKSLVLNFLQSDEFNRESNSSLTKYGQIDYSLITIDYVNGDKTKPILNFIFKSQNSISALLQVVPIPEKFEDVLPNNDMFAMMLIDYRQFSFETNNGNYQFLDLNYDDAKAIEVSMTNGKVVSARKETMSTELKEKYSYVKTKKQLGNPIFQNSQFLQARHFCDENGNNNVSYFECLGCMIYSCGNSFECAGLCGGIELVRPGYCVGSMAAACVYIAIAY